MALFWNGICMSLLFVLSTNADVNSCTTLKPSTAASKGSPTSVQCPSSSILTDCGFKSDNDADYDVGGSWHSDDSTCNAKSSYRNVGAYAYARCCTFPPSSSVACSPHSGTAITSTESAPSPSSKTQCPSGTLTGCSASLEGSVTDTSSKIQGSYPMDSTGTEITPMASSPPTATPSTTPTEQTPNPTPSPASPSSNPTVGTPSPSSPSSRPTSTPSSNPTASPISTPYECYIETAESQQASDGVYPQLTCCTGFLTCQIKWGSGNTGTTDTIQCDTDAEMMVGCSGYVSADGQSHLNAWYIDTTNTTRHTCTARKRSDPLQGTVYSAAICCESIPTESPTAYPTKKPTINPTQNPTKPPTHNPTKNPTTNPTHDPTNNPTQDPTNNPTDVPTTTPTKQPSINPTQNPTTTPSRSPTEQPSKSPSKSPSRSPTKFPTKVPSDAPSVAPSSSPSSPPTTAPSDAPSNDPSSSPSQPPTDVPSSSPSQPPSSAPSSSPSQPPTRAPSLAPSSTPSQPPSRAPSQPPTTAPSHAPSNSPSQPPTDAPSLNPTNDPSNAPSNAPSFAPSLAPSSSPSQPPTDAPSYSPSNAPSLAPSLAPIYNPTQRPTTKPTPKPSGIVEPTNYPSTPYPSRNPAIAPTYTDVSYDSSLLEWIAVGIGITGAVACVFGALQVFVQYECCDKCTKTFENTVDKEAEEKVKHLFAENVETPKKKKNGKERVVEIEEEERELTPEPRHKEMDAFEALALNSEVGDGENI
eukprot:1029129_1